MRDIIVHYENFAGLDRPVLVQQFGDGSTLEVEAQGADDFGPVFCFSQPEADFSFRFRSSGEGEEIVWEDPRLTRHLPPVDEVEFWCRVNHAFVYPFQPAQANPQTAAEFLAQLDFSPATYISNTGELTGLGANVTRDGRVQFGFFHPTAARVFVFGDFNNWQHPGIADADADQFVEMSLHKGYFGAPNIWLAVSENARAGSQYKFFVIGGLPVDDEGRSQRELVDPFARTLSPEYDHPSAVVVDPSTFRWNDPDWDTPAITELVLYEAQVWGFSEGDASVPTEKQGKFSGLTERIENGYFDTLGVNALSLMPVNEFSGMQGPTTLGYNTSVFTAIERDFGTPDDFRRMVNAAHQAGLAVVTDMVFNHADNSFNPLWKLYLEHPDEIEPGMEGGLFFSGATPWGNRLATERVEVQNFLIDVCKLMMGEYHLDGFRFDFTHSSLMSHDFLHRLADELRAVHPRVLLIAENLPNERDLNRQGFDGFAQWSNNFHDKLKAMLRQAPFEGHQADFEGIGDIFYFSKSEFAAHTNNTVNYAESHDENSVSFEVATNPDLNLPDTKERKSRLGFFASLVALGTPMIYMGQEYQLERERNHVDVPWPEDPSQSHFFEWASALIKLRRRYPALRLFGFDPVADGQFQWMLGGFLPDARRGAGCKVIGWRSQPGGEAHEAMAILLNFEPTDVTVDLDFGIPGVWVRLATLDEVHDVPPYGENGPHFDTALRTDGSFFNFVLPSSSGLIYKWQSELEE